MKIGQLRPLPQAERDRQEIADFIKSQPISNHAAYPISDGFIQQAENSKAATEDCICTGDVVRHPKVSASCPVENQNCRINGKEVTQNVNSKKSLWKAVITQIDLKTHSTRIFPLGISTNHNYLLDSGNEFEAIVRSVTVEVCKQLKEEGQELDADIVAELKHKIRRHLDRARETNKGQHFAAWALNSINIAKFKFKFRKLKQQKSSAASSAKKPWFVIPVESQPKLRWDLLIALLLIYSIFETPFAIAFLPAPCSAPAFDAANLAVDLLLCLDCGASFVASYVDPGTGAAVIDPARIAARYARGWFAADLASSAPLDWTLCHAGSRADPELASLAKLVRWVKIVRVLRVVRLIRRVRSAHGALSSTGAHIAQLCCVLFLTAHVCACVWYGIIDANACRLPADITPSASNLCGCRAADSDCQDWNWLIRYDPDMYATRWDGDVHSQYLVSLYFAVVTLTTLGYGDVVPTNHAERVFCLFLVVGGAVLFSFFVASVSALVVRGNAFENAVARRAAALTDLCRHHRLPPTAQVRAVHHVRHAAAHAPHLVQDLSLLPRAARSELVDLLAGGRLGLVPMFDGLGPDGRARLAELLLPCAFPERCEIYHALDAGAGEREREG